MISNQIVNKINKLLPQLQKKSLEPIMTKVAALVSSAIDDNFANFGRWDGNEGNINIFSGGSQSWRDLAPATIESYSRNKLTNYSNLPKATLNRSLGGLRQSIEVNPTALGINIIANKPYARIHQLGGEVLGRGINDPITIPPRPYLTLSPEELDNILELIVKFVVSN